MLHLAPVVRQAGQNCRPAEQAGRMSLEQKVELIFIPGFSTLENVNELSGRGVGIGCRQSQFDPGPEGHDSDRYDDRQGDLLQDFLASIIDPKAALWLYQGYV